METCFVMQPFDGGMYDKRYEDVFDPAIRAAGIEPYRVDRDPSVVIPIDEIEERIRKADYCVAEITTDNPNVWFELGYAIASGKPVTLLCSEDRKLNFPFDVRHRLILRYKTESPRDFENLRQRITESLKAACMNKQELTQIGDLSPTTDKGGLSNHELVALVLVGQDMAGPDDGVSAHIIRNNMERAGYTNIATTLALRSLAGKGLIAFTKNEHDREGPWWSCSLTAEGFQWLHKNEDKIELRKPRRVQPQHLVDDIPF